LAAKEFVREQTAATRERAEIILIAVVRMLHRLRQWLYARSPRWLIAAKRKMFGVTRAGSDGTRSRET
jgi:hypothetical protein